MMRNPPRPFFFEVDALKMSQVMRNLLNNAINHTPENQEIRICLTPNRLRVFRRSTAHRFRLAIQLPSPTAHRQKQPFQLPAALSRSSIPARPVPRRTALSSGMRYQRSQHQNGRRLGTGIGLSIVSTILKAHQMPYGVDCENGYNDFWFLCR